MVTLSCWMLPMQLEEEMAAMRSRQQQLRQLKEQLQMRISTEKRAPRADWTNTHFEWNSQLQQAVQSVFGLQAFRCVCHRSAADWPG